MEPILDDLLTEWQETPDRSPEDICKDHPEVLPALRDSIAILKQMERLAAADVVVPFLPAVPTPAAWGAPGDN